MVLPAIGLARAAAWAMMPRLVARYKSGAAALRYLRKIGYGYRTQSFYRDWHYWSAIPPQVKALAKLAPSKKIPKHIVAAAGRVLRQKYMYVTNVHYLIRETGQVGKRSISVLHSKLLSQTEVKRIVETRLELAIERYETPDVMSVQMAGVYKSGDM